MSQSNDTRTNIDRIQASIEYLHSDIVQTALRIAHMEWVRDYIVPELPDGVNVPDSTYGFLGNTLTLYIPLVPGRPWRGLSGTAGLVYKVRKLLGVKKFRRQIDQTYSDAGFQTEFTGYGEVDGKPLFIHVILSDQKPDNCRIEWDEVQVEAHTEKRMRTVCS